MFLILANSADPDEMQHNAAFHLGLHCLPKYPFRGLQYNAVHVLAHITLLGDLDNNTSPTRSNEILPCLYAYLLSKTYKYQKILRKY